KARRARRQLGPARNAGTRRACGRRSPPRFRTWPRNDSRGAIAFGGRFLSMRHLRVLLADDHGLVRAGMRALLAEIDGVEVVAEAADGQEALRLIRET